jgi:hypothetical protein
MGCVSGSGFMPEFLAGSLGGSWKPDNLLFFLLFEETLAIGRKYRESTVYK